ncbi:hypothetical protein LCGC14_1975980 [marine sediment metagenome]|uniref:Uncharacterized protein n=1 Tax=marine sediment metagenome TaxID=412755 RepID=A0A0F9I7G2_9ZZZZ
MADDGIYTKNADIQALAGVNAGTTAKAEAATDVYVLNVEAAINTRTGTDWSTAWTASELDDNGTMKLVLTQTGAAKCAMNVIIADPTGYSARERETALDFLNTMYEEGIKMLSGTGGSALIAGE